MDSTPSSFTKEFRQQCIATKTSNPNTLQYLHFYGSYGWLFSAFKLHYLG